VRAKLSALLAELAPGDLNGALVPTRSESMTLG